MLQRSGKPLPNHTLDSLAMVVEGVANGSIGAAARIGGCILLGIKIYPSKTRRLAANMFHSKISGTHSWLTKLITDSNNWLMHVVW